MARRDLASPAGCENCLVAGESSNEELLTAAAAGDQQAWDALVARYSGLLWNLTRRYRMPPADSGDVVQTTWLRLLENLDRIEDPRRLAGWLATTASRECLRAGKRADWPRPEEDFAVLADGGPAPGEQVLRAERDAALWQAFWMLGEPCQRLLRVLLADPAPSYAEAAVILDMKVGSIGPTRQRCLERLRAILAQRDGDPG